MRADGGDAVDVCEVVDFEVAGFADWEFSLGLGAKDAVAAPMGKAMRTG